MDKNLFFTSQWNLIKGKVKEQWGKLTDDDITMINGKRDQLLGLIQKRYNYDITRAEAELAKWELSLEETLKAKPRK